MSLIRPVTYKNSQPAYYICMQMLSKLDELNYRIAGKFDGEFNLTV